MGAGGFPGSLAGHAARVGARQLMYTLACAQEAAIRARAASRALQALSSEERVDVLRAIADTLEAHTDEILAANAEDVEASKGKISDSLLQRLILKPAKIAQLAGTRRSMEGVGTGGWGVPGWILLEYTQWTCFSLHAIHRCTCVQLDF